MRRGVILLAAVALSAAAVGEVPISKLKQLRKAKVLDKDHQEVSYRYEDEGEHLTPADQARSRADEAAEAWKQLDKREKAVAVLARSPFGGGETARSYWPAGVKGELLRGVVQPLTDSGLKVVTPDLPPAEKDDESDDAEDGDDDEERIKPYPKIGFSPDYDFVLVIGLHHEQLPDRAGGAGKVAPGRYSSRVSAWAILFHARTGSALWGATSVAAAGGATVADPLNAAAEAALGRLDFSDIGTGNIDQQIKRFSERKELPKVDVAAMLVQTQRADAVGAVIGATFAPAAFRDTAWVVRWYSDRGVVQDYRTDPAAAKAKRCVVVSQRVMMRILLMEQLRGMRGLQACVAAANVPRIDDYEISGIGQRFAAALGPVCPDDELVLIAELAQRSPYDRRGAFRRNAVRAVRNLGQCRFHIDEAMAVANVFASRKSRPGRDGRPRKDPLKEAGVSALKELAQAKAERQARTRRELRNIQEELD